MTFNTTALFAILLIVALGIIVALVVFSPAQNRKSEPYIAPELLKEYHSVQPF